MNKEFLEFLHDLQQRFLPIKGSSNNYETQNYKILTYLPFVTLFYYKISLYK